MSHYVIVVSASGLVENHGISIRAKDRPAYAAALAAQGRELVSADISVVTGWVRDTDGKFYPTDPTPAPEPEPALPDRILASLRIENGEFGVIEGAEEIAAGLVLGPTEFLIFLTKDLSGSEQDYVTLIQPIGAAGATIEDCELLGDTVWFLLSGETTPASISLVIQRAKG